ncbi:serine O-acetyltransferase [Halobacterium wangiae]|uniref:serine O-acetyltransferase n=1 Tax=Halobacterium wangiae TaxID=2902623 RepID=UPI001E3D9A50|nr:serine O-acetyltransferase [Halobacterium wangiae]
MLSRIREDVRTMRRRDPAARDDLTVFLVYPGLHAVWFHVFLAAPLYERWPLLGRLVAHFVRFGTGVEIHPGADIGRRVTIDHGAGVVVGETAVVGDDVHMYHGVTLGGDDPRPVKRHPTVGPGATIGANASLIGPIEVGADATIGAGSVVTRDVPPETTVAGIPAKPVGSGEAEPERESDD